MTLLKSNCKLCKVMAAHCSLSCLFEEPSPSCSRVCLVWQRHRSLAPLGEAIPWVWGGTNGWKGGDDLDDLTCKAGQKYQSLYINLLFQGIVNPLEGETNACCGVLLVQFHGSNGTIFQYLQCLVLNFVWFAYCKPISLVTTVRVHIDLDGMVFICRRFEGAVAKHSLLEEILIHFEITSFSQIIYTLTQDNSKKYHSLVHFTPKHMFTFHHVWLVGFCFHKCHLGK